MQQISTPTLSAAADTFLPQPPRLRSPTTATLLPSPTPHTCGARPAVQLVHAPPPEALVVDMPPPGAEGQDGLAPKGGEGEVGGRPELTQLAHPLQVVVHVAAVAVEGRQLCSLLRSSSLLSCWTQ